MSPAFVDYTDTRRFATPVTPYQRGWEDTTYEHVFAPPFPVGSVEWRQYDAGSADARQAQRQGRAM
jgi:hypothetical protein